MSPSPDRISQSDVRLTQIALADTSSSWRPKWWQAMRSAYIEWRYGRIDPHASVGKRGEQVAARWLRRQGLRVVSESESDRAGEIDVIAVDVRRRQVIFVEVKTLATRKPGHPADRVDENKQARIARAALRYLKRHQMLGISCRFDVIAIWWPGDQPFPARMEHYQEAFESPLADSYF